MRLYRFLLRRIGESIIAAFVFIVFCYVIFSFGWFDYPDQPPLSTPPPFTWDHFWMAGDVPERLLNFDRFRFYFYSVFIGDFGHSWRTSRSVGVELFSASIITLVLVLTAGIIVLGIRVFWIIGSQFEPQASPRNEKIFLLLFLIIVSILAIPYFWIIPMMSRRNPLNITYNREWYLLRIEFLWYPALILFGVLYFGYKILFSKRTLGIVPHTLVQTPESSIEVRDSISMFGVRVGLYCGLVVSSILFIESVFIPPIFAYIPFRLRDVYCGLGSNFFRSLWFRFDFPLLNAWMLSVGLALILITLIAEVCYGLWKYGPFESAWLKLSSKKFK